MYGCVCIKVCVWVGECKGLCVQGCVHARVCVRGVCVWLIKMKELNIHSVSSCGPSVTWCHFRSHGGRCVSPVLLCWSASLSQGHSRVREDLHTRALWAVCS